MRHVESAILAQNILRLFQNGKLRRVALAAILPFAGVMAAFGIAPDTVTERDANSTMVTCEPSRANACASSTATTDEPMTAKRSGMVSLANASVEVQ